jgi:hypothetical protein
MKQAVVKLIDALCYEARGQDVIFLFDLILHPYDGPELDSASK